jgi:hypothetical protein
MMPAICAAVSRGSSASIRAATPATSGLAILVPVIATQRRSGEAKPRAATISVPGAAISGLCRPSRRAVAGRAVHTLRRLFAVADGDDAIPAGERVDRRAVDVAARREIGREAPRLHIADTPQRASVVTLDPGMEAAVSYFDAMQPYHPEARFDADDLVPQPTMRSGFACLNQTNGIFRGETPIAVP